MVDLTKTAVVSPDEPSRYHFTDENPFTIVTAEGPVTLSRGWLAITEDEYEYLTEEEDEDADEDDNAAFRTGFDRIVKLIVFVALLVMCGYCIWVKEGFGAFIFGWAALEAAPD